MTTTQRIHSDYLSGLVSAEMFADVPGPEARLIDVPRFTGPGNDELDRRPLVSIGRGSVAYDFPGVNVGSVEYPSGPTGATVVHIPQGARTACDPRGGAVGLSGGYSFNHAFCLAGGSVHGLAAGSGVSHELLRRSGNSTKFADLPTVSSAIIYDFSARNTAVHPDAELGAFGLNNASNGEIAVGRAGAGVSASAGKVDWSRAEYTGQGAAFEEINGVKFLAITVPNPMGVIIDRSGRVVRGNFDPHTGLRRHPTVDFLRALSNGEAPRVEAGNTTISVLVTNLQLTDIELKQLCLQVHSSMSRGIQPFHSSMDGDTLFVATTDEVAMPDPDVSVGRLSVNSSSMGAIASEVMWDAVLSAAA